MSPYLTPADIPHYSDDELRQMSFEHAISMNEVEDMKRLFSEGVDLEADCSEYAGGNTLVMAVEAGATDAVAFLLSVGVRKDPRAVGAAACRGDSVILEMLLAAGVQPDSDSIMGVDDPKIARRLIEAGAPINESTSHGQWSALHNAVAEDRTDVVEVMLGAGANPNVTLADGTTPLMFATRGGDVEVVRILIQAGAVPYLKNEDGETALDIARQEKFEAAVVLLEQAVNLEKSSK